LHWGNPRRNAKGKFSVAVSRGLPCIFDQENNRRHNALEGKRCRGLKKTAAQGFLRGGESKIRPRRSGFITQFESQ
jgi:hypothetical protein